MTNSACKLPAFVLTFDGSHPQRHESVRQQMLAFEPAIEWQFVHGFAADDSRIEDLYDDALNRRYSKRPMGRGEIAAYAGHRRMMQRFIETGHDYGLFVEDDFGWRGTAAQWHHLIGNVDTVMAGKDMLKLFDFGPPKSGCVARAECGPIETVKPLSVGAGVVGYILGRDGAKKILSRKRVFRQIDEDIKYYWELGLEIWTVRPQMIAEISAGLGGSYLEKERALIKRRHRNLATSLKGNLLALRKKVLNRHHRSKGNAGPRS
ncbi:glycosyltransferase family 25 protein [Hoeflea prorocentri]|uniref:Glycosyl transferase family 25 domain-containing protein n=1 Tax=Hoeflea prorocentri TaxID=1922333 RepID=A0A9X3UKA4_9HYPH|nr:glycosyltransferase family 25 protein [Hoeflea prorocentri]MCY6381980.1 hypothetical protein [Hoeflea prorocentri]MDA5399780.1 hypothetical protein [Hoeflea prorocentri]